MARTPHPSDTVAASSTTRLIVFSVIALCSGWIGLLVEDALGVEGRSWRLRAADVEKAIASVNQRGFGGVLYGLSLSEWEDLLFSQARQALAGNEGRLLDWLEGFAHDKDWWQTGERP